MDVTALFNLSYGVYVVSVKHEDKMAGCIANSCIQVTAADPYILVSLNKDNASTAMIQKAKTFAVSVLSENVSTEVISTFGYQSSRDVDKFKEVAYDIIHDVPVLKTGANAYLVCDVVDIFEANTHLLFLGKVIEAEKLSTEPSMTYAYYHQVKKLKSPKNAPTYVEEDTEETKPIWICEVCGYQYEGDLMKEDDSFKCPICKKGKDKFYRK